MCLYPKIPSTPSSNPLDVDATPIDCSGITKFGPNVTVSMSEHHDNEWYMSGEFQPTSPHIQFQKIGQSHKQHSKWKEVNGSPRRTKSSLTAVFPVFLHDDVTLYFCPAPTQLAKFNQLFK